MKGKMESLEEDNSKKNRKDILFYALSGIFGLASVFSLILSVISILNLFSNQEYIVFEELLSNKLFLGTFISYFFTSILVIIFLIALLIRINKENKIIENKKPNNRILFFLSSLIIIVILVLVGFSIFCTFTFTAGGFVNRIREVEIYKKSPLKINEFYDFESVAEDNFENSYWKAIPKTKKYELSISTEHGHKSNKSLKLYGTSGEYNWQDSTKSNNYFSIIYWDYKNDKSKTLTAKALSAWLFIPKSDMHKDDNFFAHIAVYKEYKGSSTEIEKIQVFTRDIVLVQDKWVPLFLGFESVIVIDNNWDNATDNSGIDIDEIKISVFNTTKEYTGPIYFDDICIFE